MKEGGHNNQLHNWLHSGLNSRPHELLRDENEKKALV
jgi:hypothetical protein